MSGSDEVRTLSGQDICLWKLQTCVPFSLYFKKKNMKYLSFIKFFTINYDPPFFFDYFSLSERRAMWPWGNYWGQSSLCGSHRVQRPRSNWRVWAAWLGLPKRHRCLSHTRCSHFWNARLLLLFPPALATSGTCLDPPSECPEGQRRERALRRSAFPFVKGGLECPTYTVLWFEKESPVTA